MPKRLYVGVDGGASKVASCLIDGQGQQLAEFTFKGGANYHAESLEVVVDHVVEAVQGVVAESGLPGPVVIDRVVLGLAGCNFLTDITKVEQALRQSALSGLAGGQLTVVNDSLLGLYAGTQGKPGVVVIAGTGSNCYGQNKEGEEARAGGMDYILSDEGSSYDIGLRLFKMVTRSIDGRLGKTSLVAVLFDRLHVDSLEELHQKVYGEYTDKAKIASLAPLVSSAAESGDQVAQDILTHSVNELIQMVDAVIGRLGFANQAIPVVTIGSVFKEQRYFADRFAQELKRVAPKARLTEPTMTSAEAAARMASRA